MINNFYVYAFYRNQGHDGSLYDCLLDSMDQVQSVDDKARFVFLGDDIAHHSDSDWSQSLLLIDKDKTSTVFLKHRTNWDSIRSVVRSFT